MCLSFLSNITNIKSQKSQEKKTFGLKLKWPFIFFWKKFLVVFVSHIQKQQMKFGLLFDRKNIGNLFHLLLRHYYRGHDNKRRGPAKRRIGNPTRKPSPSPKKKGYMVAVTGLIKRCDTLFKRSRREKKAKGKDRLFSQCWTREPPAENERAYLREIEQFCMEKVVTMCIFLFCIYIYRKSTFFLCENVEYFYNIMFS